MFSSLIKKNSRIFSFCFRLCRKHVSFSSVGHASSGSWWQPASPIHLLKMAVFKWTLGSVDPPGWPGTPQCTKDFQIDHWLCLTLSLALKFVWALHFTDRKTEVKRWACAQGRADFQFQSSCLSFKNTSSVVFSHSGTLPRPWSPP